MTYNLWKGGVGNYIILSRLHGINFLESHSLSQYNYMYKVWRILIQVLLPLHFPLYSIFTSFPLHFSKVKKHLFLYVFPSLPHTGWSSLGHWFLQLDNGNFCRRKELKKIVKMYYLRNNNYLFTSPWLVLNATLKFHP